jgi:O-antigen biosynthesis protein
VKRLRTDDRLAGWLMGRAWLKHRLEARYKRRLERFLGSHKRLAFEQSPVPLVSVIIPVHNGAHHTLRCVTSLLTERSVSFEIILCDDASSDRTPELIQRFENVRQLRNETNLGFIGAVNKASAEARGTYLLLMNNDAALIEGRLRSAIEIFERRPDAGAVGVRLRFATGRLQEAGGMIFSDGKTDGYLWNGDPDDERARIERDVDYCSGAFLLLRAQQFRALGGLDPVYAPAYYEESDYCMKLRQLGFATVYTPAITVEHFEFGSQGAPAARNAIERNREIFVERWREMLRTADFSSPDTDLDRYARRLVTGRNVE